MFKLDLPDKPGALLGYWSDGRPFYLIAGGDGTGDGGSGDGGTGSDGGAGDGGAGDAGAGKKDGQDGGQGGTGGRADGGTGSDGGNAGGGSGTGSGDAPDPAHTQKVITAIRGDLKEKREKRQAAERLTGCAST